ncbi:hypothetical protein NRP93_000411 [Clostridium botulinum]|nr:hypothetical protein [Clostridium botulinum]
MINIIKTAIITIIISFISGMLLDYYKNLAPRILCNIGEGIPIDINNKKFHAYIVTVKNISKKTIHEITLHMQSPHSNLKTADAKITKGLKFDSSIKDNVLDVHIPFLSKDDEFSVTIYVDNNQGRYKKPAVIIRSPEKFKKVNSVKQKGVFSVFTNINNMISKIIKKDKTINKGNKEIIHRNNKLGKNKKAMIIVSSIILLMIVGAVGKFYFKGTSSNTKTPSIKTKVPKQSTDSKGSLDGTNKKPDVNSSTGGTRENTDSNKSSTSGTNKNTDSNKTSTSGTNENTNSNKPSAGGTTENSDSDKSTGGTTENTDSDKSKDGTTESTDSDKSTGGTTGNTDSNQSTDETTGNTNK